MDLKDINIEFINESFAEDLTTQSELIATILNFEPRDIDFIAEEERAFPGEKKHLESGHCQTMLKRYFFAGKNFCKNKKVLDTCCGTGWGTFIVSHFAKRIDAFDIDDKVVEFCRKNWPITNCRFYVDDGLEFKSTDVNAYDVCLAMETIEHFDRDEILRYLKNIKNSLAHGGYLIGTSAFPRDKDSAEVLRRKNPYHKCILTESEITEILSSFFGNFTLIKNWLFIAQKLD